MIVIVVITVIVVLIIILLKNLITVNFHLIKEKNYLSFYFVFMVFYYLNIIIDYRLLDFIFNLKF